MIRILIFIYRQLRLIREIGIANYLKYQMSLKGQRIKIVIKGHPVTIRKGTPDLEVAVSCLGGEFEILRYLFPETYDGVIVDAGGYIGTASIALKDIFPNAKLIIIEPSSENIEVLRDNVSHLKNIKIVHGALVGSSDKSINLNNRGTGEWGFTVVEKPSDNPNASFIQETPAFKLSDLLQENETVGLLKLDIEGGELSLLEQDMESLKNIHAVFAELHDRIVPGCKKKFFEFSEGRILIKGEEKFLSVKR